MQVRGIIRTAELVETPPESGNLELRLSVQGVGVGQPRSLVVPHALLVEDESLDPEAMAGRSFAAEYAKDDAGRAVVSQIALAGKLLRPENG